MKHYFRCKNCGGKIEHKLWHPSSMLKCPYCAKEYIVVKNVIIMILELIFLFVIAIGVRSILSFASTTLNLILELAIVIALLVGLNVLFDFIFVKVFHWPHYFYLVEREEPQKVHKKVKRRRIKLKNILKHIQKKKDA